MAVDVADPLDVGALLCEQAVVDFDARRADNRELVGAHEVEDLVHGAGGGVLDGQDAVVDISVLHGLEDVLERLHVADVGVAEELLGGKLGVRALHALAGHAPALGEHLGRGLSGLLDAGDELVVLRVAKKRVLARAGGLHEELHHDLAVGGEVGGDSRRGVGDLLALAGGIEDTFAVGALVLRDAGGDLGALAEQLEDLAVDPVDLVSKLAQFLHVGPFWVEAREARPRQIILAGGGGGPG